VKEDGGRTVFRKVSIGWDTFGHKILGVIWGLIFNLRINSFSQIFFNRLFIRFIHEYVKIYNFPRQFKYKYTVVIEGHNSTFRVFNTG